MWNKYIHQIDLVFHFTALSTSLFYKKAPSVVEKARNEVQKGKTLGKWIVDKMQFIVQLWSDWLIHLLLHRGGGV